MNEQRIRELAKQAGFYPENNWDHTNWHAAGHNPTFEKFAELIVRECCDQVRMVDAMEIKKHFGVEE
jgi:hypothetical protein